MYNEKTKENLKKGKRITKDNAREMQKRSAESKVQKRTLFEAFEQLDEDGTVSSVFETILKSGREENQVKLLSLMYQYRDKVVSRKNGELEPKAFIYERMNFNEVKPK